ncbi:universal stress protein [Desertifilum sp. FACHB-1129]|uniref:Universal stress protein UspA n=1 Tax=Desertifilum tharense IPPAS B-1220 TaxID=1781255 RepID=A0A1E5QGA6_9CYAN|nr:MULTISPECIES: universal stress protein [Desertifilum]MDA0213029.1 universal stress protein [Cyanobacteria bacterium FC1]MBD2314844.1 universal stress protein [Desertifilum sp. FACHB-1129]MBD2324837.1 universal stress protein [Desertifilum sp. FACHB-866]MBD2334915.1 universal stress protein [Desertifilum sp. FACHB-868]OEJ73363.1 universal stress protein UspA [Desertifilum tharense IPPAS B-1220]
MIKKILVTVAGRGLCEEMVNMLMEIPSIKNASVTVLHVVPSQISAQDMSAKLEAGGKILAEAVKALNLDPGQVNARLKQGDPKDLVLQVAEEEDSDLIVMGSRALGRLESILKNSVSQYVFQLTSRPMLLVKDDIYVKKIRRIMVATDGSEASQQCIKLALSFLREIPNSELLLVHVNPNSKITTIAEDPVLSEAMAQARQAGVSVSATIGRGNAGETICQIADEKNVDLLILGSPDRRPSVAKTLPDIDRLLGTSLSDYVRVKANCPVLLARTVD